MEVKRSHTSRLLVALLIVAQSIIPNRAEAVFPIPVLTGISLVFDSGALAAGYATGIGAVAAGAALLSVVFKDSGGADALRVRVNPKAARTVPSGWTPASPASNAPVPPGTAGTQTTNYYFSPNGTGGMACGSGQQTTCTTVAAVCAASQAQTPGSCTSTTGPHAPGAGSCSSGSNPRYCMVPNNTTISLNAVLSCAAGYTLSGGSCNLTNASIVVKPSDNVAESEGTGATFAHDTLDPDTASAPGNVTISGDSKSLTVTDANGTKRTVLTHETDGTLKLESWVGRGDGTSDYTKLTYGAPDGGAANGGRVATGGSVERVVGEGTAVTSTPSSGGGSVTCPGCATETTQLAVKSAVESLRDDGIAVKESAGTWSTERAAAVAAQGTLAAAVSDVQGKFDSAKTTGVGALSVPGMGDLAVPSAHEQGTFLHQLFPAAATCAPVVFSGYRSGLTVDICPVVAIGKPLAEWLLYGLTVMYLYALFWRRRQGQGA